MPLLTGIPRRRNQGVIFTYHNLNIEIQAEGIIHIESLHIVQKLNEHGTAALRAVAAEEAAVELVEQTSDGLGARSTI